MGLELISKGLTAEQAASVVRTSAYFEYPDKERAGTTASPTCRAFASGGLFSNPIPHYMAVGLVRRSDHHHFAKMRRQKES